MSTDLFVHYKFFWHGPFSLEGPLEKVAQKLLTNGKTQKQLDSDSGHSSIASSGGDSHSPLSSDPEQGLGLTTDLTDHQKILPISPPDGIAVFTNSPKGEHTSHQVVQFQFLLDA